MVENFHTGMNRVWYRAAGFVTGKNIEVKFRKPNGTLTNLVVVPESEDEGIYYLDYDFDELGQWLGIFYEDSVKTTSSIFHITPEPHNMFVTYISKVK